MGDEDSLDDGITFRIAQCFPRFRSWGILLHGLFFLSFLCLTAIVSNGLQCQSDFSAR
jgi:hypothetical protein